jgi:hypothetical protein
VGSWLAQVSLGAPKAPPAAPATPAPTPSTPQTPAKQWWENSPYLKLTDYGDYYRVESLARGSRAPGGGSWAHQSGGGYADAWYPDVAVQKTDLTRSVSDDADDDWWFIEKPGSGQGGVARLGSPGRGQGVFQYPEDDPRVGTVFAHTRAGATGTTPAPPAQSTSRRRGPPAHAPAHGFRANNPGYTPAYSGDKLSPMGAMRPQRANEGQKPPKTRGR